MSDMPSREITPPEVYFNRRTLLRAGVLAGSMAGTAGLYRLFKGSPMQANLTPELAGLVRTANAPPGSGYFVDEAQTPFESITNYNNFYEFTTDKTAGWLGLSLRSPRRIAAEVDPWTSQSGCPPSVALVVA